MTDTEFNSAIAQRFRGFLPVVVDVETAGFNAETDALLEIAAVILAMDEEGRLYPTPCHTRQVEPFPNAHLDPKSLEFNGIDPFHPFRNAMPEREALGEIFSPIRKAVKESGCNRAILVGHNAFFDLGFLNAAVARANIKRNPFHPFSTFDTVSLSGLAFGQTVLAKAAMAAGLGWDNKQAHTATYDTEKTAELFCSIVNHWHQMVPGQPWLEETT